MSDFQPFDYKNATPEQHRDMRDRIIESYLEASPEHKKAGHRWYEQAHRSAVHVARDIDPNSDTARAHHRARYTPPADAGDVSRAAGAIARLSPSNPAGMRWQTPQGRLENAGAAYAVKHMTPEQVDMFQKNRSVPRGAQDVRKAGGYSVQRAHGILHGHVTPEEDMLTKTSPRTGRVTDARKKIGSFYQNINNPRDSQAATVDSRSHDIALGEKGLGWNTDRGLGTVGRYRAMENAHVEATNILRDITENPRLAPHQVQATSWLHDYDQVNRRKSNG